MKRKGLFIHQMILSPQIKSSQTDQDIKTLHTRLEIPRNDSQPNDSSLLGTNNGSSLCKNDFGNIAGDLKASTKGMHLRLINDMERQKNGPAFVIFHETCFKCTSPQTILMIFKRVSRHHALDESIHSETGSSTA